MQNRQQSKVNGISHFFLAIGILILSLFAMTGVAMLVVQKVFGLRVDELTDFVLADATLPQTLALKLAQGITVFAFIIAGFVATKTFRQPFTSFTGLANPIIPIHIGLGIVLLVLLMPIVDGLFRLNAGWSLPDSWESTFKTLEDTGNHTYALLLKYNQGGQFFLNLLIMSVLAAVGEEIFFRGILMRVLTKWFGNVHIGIITSTMLFVIIHFQPYKVLPMLLLGLFLGYIYYRTKSLWVPIILHALNNAIVVVADWSEKSGNEWTIFSDDFQFSVLQIIFSIVAFLGIGYMFWKQTNDNDFSYE